VKAKRKKIVSGVEDGGRGEDIERKDREKKLIKREERKKTKRKVEMEYREDKMQKKKTML
jgi:hypothetical protein